MMSKVVMDIEKELRNIVARKEGNAELVLTYDNSTWVLSLNITIALGEDNTELETSGNNIEEVILKMKILLT